MQRRLFLKGVGVVTVVVVDGGVWRAHDQGVFSVGQGPAYEPWKDFVGYPAAARQLSGSASFSESRSGKIGHISFGAKQTRKPSAGNLHAGFDAAGTGNQFTVWLLRHSQRKRRGTLG